MAWSSIVPILNIYGSMTVLVLLTIRGLRLITYEERELPAKFGQAYLDWKRYASLTHMLSTASELNGDGDIANSRVPPLFPRSFGELVASMMAKPKDQWICNIPSSIYLCVACLLLMHGHVVWCNRWYQR